MAARARISRAKGRVEDDGLPPKMLVSLTNPHLHHHHHQLLCAQSSGEPRAATDGRTQRPCGEEGFMAQWGGDDPPDFCSNAWGRRQVGDGLC